MRVKWFLLFFIFLVNISGSYALNNVCVNETQNCFDTIQEAINSATNGQTVVIINATDYNESIVLNKSIALTSNQTTKPTIFTNISSVPGKTIINVTSGNSSISNIFVKYNGTGSSTKGITAFKVNNVTIADVDVWVKSTSSNYGIYLTYSNQSVVNNSNSSGNYNGFYIYYSNNNNFTNNIANNNEEGLSIAYSDNNTIVSNLLTNITRRVFYISTSNNTNFTNNTINHSISGTYDVYGFDFYNSFNSTLSDNNITSTHTSSKKEQGLYIEGDSLLHFRHNISESNKINNLPILYIDGEARICPNNTIYNNGSSYGYMGFVGCNNITVRDSSPLDGIILVFTTNFTISNLNISFSIYPFYFYYSNNNTIVNNIANNNSEEGFSVYYSNYTNFTNNTANNTDEYYGFYMENSYYTNFTNNTANNGYKGFQFESIGFINFINNTANSNENRGVILWCYDNNFTVDGNTIENNAIAGFDIYECNNTTLINNVAINDGDSSFDISGDMTNLLMTNNTAKNSEFGFYIWDGVNNITLINNTANDNDQYGFLIDYQTSDITLINNTANNNSCAGVYLGTEDNDTIIFNNTFNNNGEYGIFTIQVDGVSFINNTVQNNTFMNIWICAGRNYNITSNNLNASMLGILIGHYNSSYGFSCDKTSPESNNTIIKDNIIANTTLWDIFIRNSTSAGNPNVFSINNSLNKSKLNITKNGTLYNQYYLDVLVYNSTGPLASATVIGNDSGIYTSLNPTPSFSNTTNTSGYITQQVLTEFMANASNTTPSTFYYFSNYSVNASKAEYNNSTTVNLTSSQFVNLTLSIPPPPLCYVVVNETGICWNTTQEAINNATTGQTVIILNASKEYNESVVLNKSIILTSNSTPLPLIFADVTGKYVINVSAGNVTLKRLLVKYNGTATTTYAIVASYANNVTIENSTINNTGSGNYGYGTYFLRSNSSLIKNNTIYTANGNYNHGANLENSVNNTVMDNIINATGEWSDCGIRATISGTLDTNITIVNNTITSIGSGIYVSTANISIINNTIFTNGTYGYNVGIDFGEDRSVIAYNNINTDGDDGYNYGINIDSGSNQTVFNNTINTNGGSGDCCNYGILINSDFNSTVFNNTINTNGLSSENTGILTNSDNDTIIDNIINTNGVSNWNFGISYQGWLGNITNNIITTNGTADNYGLYLASNNATVSNCTISTNGTSTNNHGIQFYGDNYIVTNCNVTTYSAGSYGVHLDWSNNNYVIDSKINSTQSFDIYNYYTGDNYVINSSFNKSDIDFDPTADNKLFVQYRLDVKIVDSDGNPIDSATVIGNDSGTYTSLNPTSNFSQSTNSSGYITQQVLTEFLANQTYNATSGYLYFTNYTVNASKSGYNSNSTTVNLTSSQSIILTLTSTYTPPPPGPPGGSTGDSPGGGGALKDLPVSVSMPINVTAYPQKTTPVSINLTSLATTYSLFNVSILIRGLDASWYSLDTTNIPIFAANQSRIITLSITPKEIGNYTINLTATNGYSSKSAFSRLDVVSSSQATNQTTESKPQIDISKAIKDNAVFIAVPIVGIAIYFVIRFLRTKRYSRISHIRMSYK